MRNKKIIILLFFCLHAAIGMSQNTEGWFQEEKVPDENSKAATAAKALRESAISLSKNNYYGVVKPVYDRESETWSTQSAWNKKRPNVNVSKPASAPRSTTSSSSTSSRSGKKTIIGAGTINNSVRTDRSAQIEAAKERARLQAIENKRKDNEAKMRMMVNYNAAMAGARQQNAMRDNYMATEGARQLDETLKAEKFMQKPDDSFNASGEELAKKLEGKDKYGYGVVSYDEVMRQKGLAGDSDDKEVSMYNSGSFSQDEADRWTSLLNQQQGEVTLPAKMKPYSKKTTYRIIIPADRIELDSLQLSVLDGMGVVALYRDSILCLCDSAMRMFTWDMQEVNIDQAVNAGRHIIAKDGNLLLDIHTLDKTIDTLAVMDVDYFNISPMNETSVTLSTAYENLSVVHVLDITTHEQREVVRTPYFVQKTAYSNKFKRFMALVEDFRILCLDNKAYTYYISDEYIYDIAYCQQGLLIATAKNILLIDTTTSKPKPSLLLERGAKRLWIDHNHIYAQDIDNNLIEIINNK